MVTTILNQDFIEPVQRFRNIAKPTKETRLQIETQYNNSFGIHKTNFLINLKKEAKSTFNEIYKYKLILTGLIWVTLGLCSFLLSKVLYMFNFISFNNKINIQESIDYYSTYGALLYILGYTHRVIEKTYKYILYSCINRVSNKNKFDTIV